MPPTYNAEEQPESKPDWHTHCRTSLVFPWSFLSWQCGGGIHCSPPFLRRRVILWYSELTAVEIMDGTNLVDIVWSFDWLSLGMVTRPRSDTGGEKLACRVQSSVNERSEGVEGSAISVEIACEGLPGCSRLLRVLWVLLWLAGGSNGGDAMSVSSSFE